jgi:hypothetical protein
MKTSVLIMKYGIIILNRFKSAVQYLMEVEFKGLLVSTIKAISVNALHQSPKLLIFALADKNGELEESYKTHLL